MRTLPPELYDAVLGFVPSLSLQNTTYSLALALPFYSRYLIDNYLFTHINLAHPRQVRSFYLRLRAHPNDILRIKTFALTSWNVDADVVVNVIRLISEVQEMTLYIGINFAPEHLEEIFERPMKKLQFLGLRFRPYVERATYLQFLKGAYFDTTLKALGTWPSNGIPSISIVQDPLSERFRDKEAFAQPLVFFRLDAFMNLAASSYTSSVTNLRLRIPSRHVAKYLYIHPKSLPNLAILDLSTCHVPEMEVDEILLRFKKLKHLIVDYCDILRGEWREGDWAVLGKNCALAGVKRSKKREKKVKEWLDINSVVVNGMQTMLVGPQPTAPVKKAKRGRKGLAMPSFKLREEQQAPTNGATPTTVVGGYVQKIRVLPSLPNLASFATTVHPSIDEEKQQDIRREFAAGWRQGLLQLSAVRKRMLQSWMNGFRIVRDDEEDPALGEDGLEGLIDLAHGDEDMLLLDIEALSELCPCPVLCFAANAADGHTDGCGHLRDSKWNMLDSESR